MNIYDEEDELSEKEKRMSDKSFDVGYWAGVCDVVFYTFIFFLIYFVFKGFK